MPKWKRPPIHTVPNPKGGWNNKREGDPTPISHHRTKENAVERGRQIAKQDQTEHIIHNKDGKISQRNSYGNDPYPPRG